MRIAATIVATAGLALLATACGGSPASPVAHLGSTTTPSGASSGGSHSEGSTRANALRFSQCVRSHGIPDFPDPNAIGQIEIISPGPNSDLDRGNPALQTAQQACERSTGFNPDAPMTPAQRATLLSADLSFARCMRSHGIHDFPDPVLGSQGGGFPLHGSPGGDLSNNPIFLRAVQACQHILVDHKFHFAFGPSGNGKGG